MRTVSLTHQRVTIQDDFDLDKILESGQCFRPRKLADGRCRFVSGKALLYLTPLGCGQYDAAWYGADWDVWAGYFDLGRSYAALRQSLAGQSAYLDAALAFGQGIRVLRQDPWEMLVTFIISQRKSIPAIRTAVEQLARCCGEPLCAEGDEVFLFPTPEQLCGLTEAQLTGCGLGYRTRYIQHAAAQAAADDYLHSVQASLADTNATAANTLSQARSEAKRILEQAQADADSLKAQAQQECDAMTAAAAQKRTQTEADCKAMVERAEQEVQQRWQAFDHKANELLDQYRSTDGLPSEET